MTNQRSHFTYFEEIHDCSVDGIGGVRVKALGVGTVPIVSYINGVSKAGVLHGVLYVPELGTNLLSVGIAADNNIEARFEKGGAVSIKDGVVVMSGTRLGKLIYQLNVIAKNIIEEVSSFVAGGARNNIR